ncbi:LPS-assembly protein LptD [Dissostichus eleginoides]|uniref:LPS-assembly protein LptD n=1 Tax=Dissostichus eleginoides TaxID=100907 RepID=A0AAD9EU67_DISEL|nr:LPS-assembly protein LptD [Dissostichus eleginoides]
MTTPQGRTACWKLKKLSMEILFRTPILIRPWMNLPRKEKKKVGRKSQDSKVDQERAEEQKKCRRPTFDSERLFWKARVTVLRTSL